MEPAELLRVHSKVSGGGKASTSHVTVVGSCRAAPMIFISFLWHSGRSVGKKVMLLSIDNIFFIW